MITRSRRYRLFSLSNRYLWRVVRDNVSIITSNSSFSASGRIVVFVRLLFTGILG